MKVVKPAETAKYPENYKRSPSTINEVEQVPLMYNKYQFIPKKSPQKTIAFTAKEQMDHKNDLKRRKSEQKKQVLEKKLEQGTLEMNKLKKYKS